MVSHKVRNASSPKHRLQSRMNLFLGFKIFVHLCPWLLLCEIWVVTVVQNKNNVNNRSWNSENAWTSALLALQLIRCYLTYCYCWSTVHVRSTGELCSVWAGGKHSKLSLQFMLLSDIQHKETTTGVQLWFEGALLLCYFSLIRKLKYRGAHVEGSSVRSFFHLGFTPVTAVGQEGGAKLVKRMAERLRQQMDNKGDDGGLPLRHVLPFILFISCAAREGLFRDSPQRLFNHSEGTSLPQTLYVHQYICSLATGH